MLPTELVAIAAFASACIGRNYMPAGELVAIAA